MSTVSCHPEIDSRLSPSSASVLLNVFAVVMVTDDAIVCLVLLESVCDKEGMEERVSHFPIFSPNKSQTDSPKKSYVL